MPLVGLEADERPRRGLDDLVARTEGRGAVDDDNPRVLLDLVVAERLPGIEADEDRSGFILAPEDDGRATPTRSLDVREHPGLHRAEV